MPRDPWTKLKPSREICLELQDYSTVRKSAVELFGLRSSADPQAQAARLADQFILQNKPFLELLHVGIQRDYDGNDVLLQMQSKANIGAIPLISPISARPDFGLVVQPRFPWAGIGPMLAEMGWLISPTPLRLPLLKRSERRVPGWVLSLTILVRVKALLDGLERRFELMSDVKTAPKGRVNWTEYITRNVVRGGFLHVPCTFPDLQEDRDLKGAIRFTLERQIQSLETQLQHGSFVHQLVAFAHSLLIRVQLVPVRFPTALQLLQWLRRPFRTDALTEGIQAIEWTVDERGLGGLSDLEGIPWMMPMEQFFEAWVETVLRRVALRTGGVLRSGRRRETLAAIAWNPPYIASQRSLVPDLILGFEKVTVIIDAKYKRHWEELHTKTWVTQPDDVQEQHRQDILQILAYANLADSPQVICCIAYPCFMTTWESLLRRQLLFNCAELPNRNRSIQIWLTALPMHASVERIALPLVERIRDVLAA